MAGANPFNYANKSNTVFEHRKKKNLEPIAYSKAAEVIKKIVFAILLVVVFYPPFFRGLFFEENQFPTEIIVFSAFALFWISKWLNKDKSFIKTPIEYASLGFVFVYFISILVSVSLRLAVAEWLKYCMYFAVFFMLSDLVKSLQLKIAVLWTVIASAVGVSLLGIDGAAGSYVAKVINKFFPPEYPLIFDTFKDGRIFSTLQYPNAVASLLMAIFFITLVLTAILPRISQKILAGISGFILLFTFIFTLSRGAFVMFPIIAVLFLLFLPKGSRIRGAVFALTTAIATMSVSIKMSQYILNPEGNSFKIWMLVVTGTLVAAVLTLVANYALRWLEQLSWKVYAGIVAVVTVMGIVILVAALNIKAPLEIGHSASQTDSNISVMKSAILKPGNEYKLRYSVNASIEGDKPLAYTVNVTSRSDKDILQEAYPSVIADNGKRTNGTEKRELIFKVPDNSRVIDIFFTNYYQGTKATFYQGEILDAKTGEVVKELTMNYKYLPLSVMSRFEDITTAKSNVERRIFYQDGLKSVKDHWLVGAGGGAWKLLYFTYQSYLYWTTESHNYFLQIAVECGVAGLIVLMMFIGSILASFISEYRFKRASENGERILQAGLLTAIIALLMHSAIDFDFSLSSVFLVMWVLSALFNSRYRSDEELEITDHNNSGINSLLKVADITNKIGQVKVPQLLIVLVSIVILIIPALFYSGLKSQRAYEDALEAGNYDAAYKAIKNAADTDFINPDYKTRFASLVLQNKKLTAEDIKNTDKVVQSAETMTKYNVSGSGSIGGYYIVTGKVMKDEARIEKGLTFVRKALELRPLNPMDWQQLAGAYHDVAMYYFSKQQPEKALGYVDQGLKLMEDAKEKNKKNVVPFVFTPKTQEILERLQYVKENIKKGGNLNISLVSFNSLAGFDVDSNGIPDQFSEVTPGTVTIANNDGMILFEKMMSEPQGLIQSRILNLKARKSYKVQIELNNPQGIGSIPFYISNINGVSGELKPAENIYAGEFTLPGEFIANNDTLILGITSKIEVKKINIVER